MRFWRNRVSYSNDKFISQGWHYTYGYLRRKEMDNHYGYCYEEPGGDLIYSNNPAHHNMAIFNCYQDKKTGEKYVSFAKVRV